MATTPPTSISSSYSRLAGPTPVITQGTTGPELSEATRERLRLAEERKLDEEKRAAKRRRLEGMSPLERSEEGAKQYADEMAKNKAAFDRMYGAKGMQPPPKYQPKAGDFNFGFKGI